MEKVEREQETNKSTTTWVQIPSPAPTTESLYSNDILSFLWHLKKRGYKESTIKENYSKILRHLARHCNLNNPESVVEYVAKKHVSSGRKELIINCYMNYCKFKGIHFNPPRYKRVDKLPYVPSEQDIEALIAALPKKLSIFTRVVKETGARPGEVWSLMWQDIDFERNMIYINHPEKGSKARAIRVPSQVIALLNKLPRKTRYVFRSKVDAKLKNFQRYFIRRKKMIAEELCNPKIELITWKSLRHWKGTMEYYKTKDILHVKELLGHKNINNTLIYTHLVDFKEDEYICKAAKTLEEAKALIEKGFEYVCEMDGFKLFRKRK